MVRLVSGQGQQPWDSSSSSVWGRGSTNACRLPKQAQRDVGAVMQQAPVPCTPPSPAPTHCNHARRLNRRCMGNSTPAFCIAPRHTSSE